MRASVRAVARARLLPLLLACALVLSLSLSFLPLSAAQSLALVPVGGCALGSRILRPAAAVTAMLPRAQMDGSAAASGSGSASASDARTVLFTGSPIRAADTLRAFDFYVARAPAQFFIQVYRPVGGGASARRMQLAFSLPVSVVGAGPVSPTSQGAAAGALQGAGAHRVSVQWRVHAGDVLALAWSGSGASATPALPFDAPSEDEALSDESWVTMWAQANARVGDSLARTPQGGSAQRIYRFDAHKSTRRAEGGQAARLYSYSRCCAHFPNFLAFSLDSAFFVQLCCVLGFGLRRRWLSGVEQ